MAHKPRLIAIPSLADNFWFEFVVLLLVLALVIMGGAAILDWRWS